ncbi:MAG: glycosyl hydrolase 53 family protein [Oscillospiraceae bacterium]|nr:glycosyl hydrolase 53 family protein [Oscillospiraceae bacterium]
MRKKHWMLLPLLPLLLGLGGCAAPYQPQTEITSETLAVKPIPALPEDFIFGMDLSSALSEEESGVRYYDFAGRETDVFKLMRDCGVTHVRIRVWNDPFDAEGNAYGGGNCSPERAVQIGKRAAAYGLKLIVDFHYSDFWADPSKQTPPKAWQGMDIEEKTQALYDFTRETLQRFKSAGVDVTMVQVGNETNRFLCGETTWYHIQRLLQAGSKAVREVFPQALVAVHFSNPEKDGTYREYAERLDEYGVDYDVFASSYYPFWHGTLENLSALLTEIAQTYGKKVIVMETSYAYTADDSDFFANTVGADSALDKPYPYSVQGQADALWDVIDTVARLPGGMGVVYWEGAWISVGGASWEENRALWEQYGSGWASVYAADYDPDAGRYHGGCAVDNQAFFDPKGHPLESLKLFGLLRSGNQIGTASDD